jgi:branched-chain amino acid transport system ATP-binding protein
MTVGGPKPEQLVAEQIRVHFEGVKAVDGVDLTLERGEIMGLIGPNGAGKTTFMNAVSNFVPRTSGRVILAGRDVTSWPPHRLASAGLVRTFQDVATFPDLTVFENVELGALGAGLSRRKARARAWSLLEDLGLERMAAMPASALPHGEERRVGIARAVAVGPRFLLLDEPAAGLDGVEQDDLARRLGELAQGGIAILVIEHNMDFLMGLAQRIVCLDRGRVIAVGTPAEIRCDPDVLTAYLGAAPGQPA